MAHHHRLIRHGFVLFLLGLLAGVVAYRLDNPRMGVSAHLEGITNGMFLVLLGLAWNHLRLSARVQKLAFWSAIVGSYANWAIPLFSAAVGASQPILAGAGFEAAPWQESLIAATPLFGVGAPILCCTIVLWGLRTRPAGGTTA